MSIETCCADSSSSVHVSSHARTRTRASLTVSCLARPAGASAAVAAVASSAVSCVRSYAQVAAAACDDTVALHDSSLRSCNSGGTGGLLPVQRSTSYRLGNSCVGSNSCRKVRSCSTIGSRSVVQTVDMSHRSCGHVRQGAQGDIRGPGPGSGPGGRSGLVGGFLGPRCSLSRDSLLFGDATWASPACTAITRVEVGLWYREVGSLGAKG